MSSFCDKSGILNLEPRQEILECTNLYPNINMEKVDVKN